VGNICPDSLKVIKWGMLVACNRGGKNRHTVFVAGNYEARIFLEDTVMIEWIILKWVLSEIGYTVVCVCVWVFSVSMVFLQAM
jgi:hypothetical protein